MTFAYKIVILFSLILSLNIRAQDITVENPTKTPEDDRLKIEEYNQACQVINTLLVKKQFSVGCFSNYQYFGPTSVALKRSSLTGNNLRIAGYNLLHPGTSKALFKDYSLVAKIMNNFDIVSGLEILGTVGHEEENNQAVLGLIKNSPKLISDLQNLKSKQKDPKKITEIENKITKLTLDTRSAYSLYRAPGYFKILMALKQIDPSWALILSPRGDSALQGSVEEMVGFYYRANAVSPVVNPHCNEFKNEDAGSPVACILNLSSSFMDKDYTHHFARRPFMVSFQSGNLKFSMISMHVVFTFSGDEAAEKILMNDVFGVDSASDLSPGINSSNFARFAEVKTTLEFMNRFKQKYNDGKIMFVSDTNIVGNNQFWPEVLKSFPGSSLVVNEVSTLSPPRYLADGQETNGVASSYDHFVLDKTAFPSCDDGHVYNYYKSPIEADIEKHYMVRDLSPVTLKSTKYDYFNFNLFTDTDGALVGGDVPPDDLPVPVKLDYPITAQGQVKMDNMVAAYATQLKAMLTVKNNTVVADDFQVQERIDGFKRRIFTNQLTNAFYYRFYQEILSDHFPISINCKN